MWIQDFFKGILTLCVRAFLLFSNELLDLLEWKQNLAHVPNCCLSLYVFYGDHDPDADQKILNFFYY